MKLFSFITMLLAVFNISYSKENVVSPEKEKAIKLLVYDEQTISALKIFTLEITKSGQQKNVTETADNLYWIAECFFQLKKLRPLENILKTGEPFALRHDTKTYFKLKTIKGKYLIEKGNYTEAIQLLTELSAQVSNNSQLCEIRLTLADANQRLQLLDLSKMHYDFVLINATDIIQQARANNGKGSYFCVLSDFDSATIYYNTALKLFLQKLGAQHSRSGQVYYNLGLIADRKFDLNEAELYFTKALQIYKSRLGDLHPRTAETYGTLGSLFLMKDNPGKALYYSIKERDILLQLYGKDNPDLAYSYLNCGKIYYLLNERQKAKEQLVLAKYLVINYFGKKHNLYSQCIVELSKIYTDQQDFKSANDMLFEIIQLKKNNPDDYLGDVYLQAGENHLAEKKYQEAIQEFKTAHHLYNQYYGNRNIYSIDALLGLSNVYLQQQLGKEAYEMAEQALSLTKNTEQIIYPYDHWKCVVQQLQCKKLLYNKNIIAVQNIKNDLDLIKQTLQEAHRIKNTLHNSGSQQYYAEKMAELNQLGIYFLTHFYNKTDTYFLNSLLYFAENNKANLLRNKIINYKAVEILPEHERVISSAITGKLNYFITLNENPESVSFNINDSILFYQNQYEQFTKQIERKYPKIYALKYGTKPLTVKQIQDKLTDDQTILEYCNDNENYYCLAISKDQITYKICDSKNKLDALIYSWKSSILNKKNNVEISHQLYTRLLPTTLKQHILICADDIIHHVAFDALAAGQNSSDYLILSHTIQNVFSVNTYFNHSPPVSNKNIIAFYPDFTNSSFAVLNNKEEHEALKTFSGYAVYYNEKASKDHFISLCNSACIIHIGSHLIIDTITPMKSFLVFQPSGNYALSIDEIWKLNASCQLITMASCQSNFGRQQIGEGMQNFAWAFYYAGAHNILSTQWNASDKSTGIIVSNFYKNLKNGKSKEEALQLAKIHYLKNADAIGAQPFFWANFNLFGDNSEVSVAPHFFVKFWWIPVLLLLLSYLAMAITRKIYRKQQYDHL